MTNTQEWLPGRCQTKKATVPSYMTAKQFGLVLHCCNYCFYSFLHCVPIAPMFCSGNISQHSPTTHQSPCLLFKLMPFEVCLYSFWSSKRPSVDSTARNILIHEKTTSSVITGAPRTLLGYLEGCRNAKKLPPSPPHFLLPVLHQLWNESNWNKRQRPFILISQTWS